VQSRIKQLEKIARQLEPDFDAREVLTDRVQRYAQTFLDELPDAPAYVGEEPDESALTAPFEETPGDIEAALNVLRYEVDTPGINPASGRHLGYIPGGGVYPAALGDYLADVSNRYAGVAYASPGAVRLEKHLVRWLADMVGFGPSSGGDLTSGGSIANLIGIVVARDAHNLKACDIPNAVVYLTAHTHHCVDKALRVAGLRECQLRRIAMDARFRMAPAALEAAIEEDLAQGLAPWLVVASMGSTDVGAVDPVDAIAPIARKHGLWLHVDAAYGGFFMLCEPGREALAGIDEADSLVIDPHKGLFLPYGSGAVLVRDETALHLSHYYQSSYMQDAQEAALELSPADLSPELSRPFRGLRMWLPLKLAGLAPFRAALEEKLELARYFYEQLGKLPGFERGPAPQLSVVVYRYVPARGDADAFNRALVEAVLRDGRVFLSTTQLDGQLWLRMAAMSFRTHVDTIDLYLELLESTVAALEQNG
ncbi:MAG: aminotransferase class V-fold PLP-dependent enzyme, partial [Pseudomonadota bacterium]